MENMVKKIIFVIVLILIAALLIAGIRLVFNPLTRSEDTIRQKMLSQFPVGTHMDDIIQFANHKKDWSDVKISYINGYSIDRGEEVGKKRISVHIGEYQIFFVTDVEVFFGFNENSELIDIRVRKTIDSL
ncbi:hypothetical protein [Paenibacillus chungangensis]|uniref:Uncharacterized protein n=1 Tax=Paenibacillus chungangensis TaxID=696535 RepID=A0ABW3HNM6_9BACL